MQCYPIPVPSLNTAQQYAETAGNTSSLPEPQSPQNAPQSSAPADTGANPQAPGGVLFYRQALVDQQTQQPKPTRKQKGRAATSAGE